MGESELGPIRQTEVVEVSFTQNAADPLEIPGTFDSSEMSGPFARALRAPAIERFGYIDGLCEFSWRTRRGVAGGGGGCRHVGVTVERIGLTHTARVVSNDVEPVEQQRARARSTLSDAVDEVGEKGEAACAGTAHIEYNRPSSLVAQPRAVASECKLGRCARWSGAIERHSQGCAFQAGHRRVDTGHPGQGRNRLQRRSGRRGASRGSSPSGPRTRRCFRTRVGAIRTAAKERRDEHDERCEESAAVHGGQGRGPTLSDVRVVESPLQIGGTTSVRNRLYRAPVLEGAGDGPGAGAVYAKHFVENARHGVGLIIQGSACLALEGRTSPGMTCVHERDRVMALAPMVDAVHEQGAAIWLQVGHGGIFAMEAWHQPYAQSRKEPIWAVSAPRGSAKLALRGVPVKVLTTADIVELVAQYGRIAGWAREAGYDGIQLASANAKLLDQFLSPHYNRRNDNYGGSARNRAEILRQIRAAVAREAGADFTCSVKIPVAEAGAPWMRRTSWAEGIELAKWCEEWGFDAVTPVHVSVFPDTTLTKGGVPWSLWRNKAMSTRFNKALPSRWCRAVIGAGYVSGAATARFVPVWNRSRVEAVQGAVSIPVFAVGGIREAAEVDDLLDSGVADMVGIGRPFYADPAVAAKLLEGAAGTTRCRNSNRCVPAQMLGMKGVCYHPEVVRGTRETGNGG